MRLITNILGVVFILVGLVGFANHHLMGMHLTTLHNILHLVTGVIALYLGIKGTDRAVRMWCRGFGIAYALLGLIGFAFGGDAFTIKGFMGQYGDNVMKLIPGHLELGRGDHIMHVILGVLFLVAGFIPADVDRRVRESTDRVKERAQTAGRS